MMGGREGGWEGRMVKGREGVGIARGIRGWLWNACIFMNINEASMICTNFAQISVCFFFDIGDIFKPQFLH